MNDLPSASLLAAIFDKLDRIEAYLEARHPQRDDELRRLLPALLGALGSEPFAAAEALEYPAVAVLRSRRMSPSNRRSARTVHATRAVP